MIEIADAIGQGADGKVFGCIGHEVPHHPLPWRNPPQQRQSEIPHQAAAERCRHVLPALLGFSATQAIVIPPISESLKRSRKVPLGLDMSMS